MGGVRRETIENNVVLKTKLQDFEGFVRPKAVINQHPWLLISSLLSLEIKYTLLAFLEVRLLDSLLIINFPSRVLNEEVVDRLFKAPDLVNFPRLLVQALTVATAL
jgi:hypothetical protein